MIEQAQKEKAKNFQNLHKQNKMFVLPNAWDVGSAYVFEKQGFKAVATSSAGIAYDLGYPDGENVSFDDLLYIVKKICNRINIPVSVDFERGYGDTKEEVKEHARRLLLAGAVGFNIEDGLPNGSLADLDEQISRIKILTELKKEMDINFVINARTCAYWLDIGNEEVKLKTAIERGCAFAAAGADCIFIPGAIDKSTVSQLVSGIKVPINIILNGKFNDFEELEKIGVRRLSVGSGPVRYIYKKTIELADNLYDGKVTDMLANDFTYDKANMYFRRT